MADRDGFDRGQQGWTALRELPGFLGPVRRLEQAPGRRRDREHRRLLGGFGQLRVATICRWFAAVRRLDAS
ncbi:hypothetical protein AB0L88_25360 [Saccharopolyspora shandongensis]